jgi:hypothetical protein
MTAQSPDRILRLNIVLSRAPSIARWRMAPFPDRCALPPAAWAGGSPPSMTGSEIPCFIASRMVNAASSPFWRQLALYRHWLGLHFSHRSFPLSAATTLNSSPPLSLLRRGNFPPGSYAMGMTPCPFACRLDKNGPADFYWLGDILLSPLQSRQLEKLPLGA